MPTSRASRTRTALAPACGRRRTSWCGILPLSVLSKVECRLFVPAEDGFGAHARVAGLAGAFCQMTMYAMFINGRSHYLHAVWKLFSFAANVREAQDLFW